MSRASKKDREEFVAVLTKELGNVEPLEAAAAARALMRLASTWQRIQVDKCNRPQTGTDEAREFKTENLLVGWAKRYRLSLDLGGDPRGYTVKVKLPSGRYNTWGGKEDGWGVPTS